MQKDFLKNGLSQKEAEKLLKKHGVNEIERKRELSSFKILLDQFKSPLIYILFFAGLVTLFLGETTDSAVIFLAVFVNTILGFFQEAKAEKSLIALRKLIVSKAYVVRDGQEIQIEASQIVPGDLVVLKTGEKIPADGAVVEGADLHVNEAILTGESMPIAKEKLQASSFKLQARNFSPEEKNYVYMGTVVVSGRGRMVVTKTGMKTKMGSIAGGLSETVDEETPLKKKIGAFSKKLTVIFSVICLLILVEGLLRGRHFLEMFELAVATAVAAIPEGLVISMTVILTLGMQKLLKRKALVRKLLAAETLGSVSVICADKTGTLTKGKMKVAKQLPVSSHQSSALLRAAVLCNNMINPLEIAMMNWAKKKVQGSRFKVQGLTGENKRIEEIPFSSKNKFIATLYEKELFVSGAPEKILAVSKLSKKQKETWLKKLDGFTSKGLRVVSFAFKKGGAARAVFNKLKKIDSKSMDSLKGELEWLGLLAFEDPVRMEVKEALNACKRAGIKIKVITGDYRETAIAVINKLKIQNEKLKIEEVIEGYELSKMTNEELVKRVNDVVLFARTNPEDKIRIVEALQKNGEVVAMMGDGVNDALALKKADIGIVVGEASEVAKETADMVLLDSNFNTIVTAVNEGRAIFENIRKVVLYLLSDSFTEVILISAALLLGVPIPISAVQILWVNLIEDGLPGLALAFEPEEEGLMNEPPRDPKESILNKEVKILIFIIGVFTDLLLLGLFLFLWKRGIDLRTIRTVIFAGLAIDSLAYVFSCKTLRRNLWHERAFSNKFLNVSAFVGFLMLAAGIYLPFFNKLLNTIPLHLNYWLLILLIGIIDIIGIEGVKYLFIVRERSNH